MEWTRIADGVYQALWIGGLATIPLAIAVAVFCRLRIRPATRHALWVSVLASFLTPAVATVVWQPDWFRSDQVLGAIGPADETPIARSAEEAPPRDSLPASAAPHDSVAPALSVLAEHPLRDEGNVATPANPAARQADIKPTATSSRSSSHRRALVARTESECEVREPDPREPATTAAPEASGATALTAPAVTSEVNASPVADANVGEALEPTAGAATGWTLWLARVLAVRDAIASVPPLPHPAWITAWLAGVLCLVAIRLLREFAMWRLVVSAREAPPELSFLVRRVARDIGVGRVPRLRVTEARVSPMVAGYLRPTLVIPIHLWDSLDRDSRRTVLVHELAHVRRRDQLISAAASAVGYLFWWHPIAWWARRQLGAAAEACCDAWVTDVIPTGRRAYAHALVHTTAFLSSDARRGGSAAWTGASPLCPVVGTHVGLAMVARGPRTSGPTSKLARRITMVMTQHPSPRMSLIGVLAVALAIGVGAFVTPSLACPPEDCPDKASASADAKAKIKAELKAVEKARAKALKDAARSFGSNVDVEFLGEGPALEAMIAPRAGQAAPRGRGGQAPIAIVGPSGIRGQAFVSPPAGVPMPAPAVAQSWRFNAPHPLADNGEPVARPYRLSDGKLDALIELMAREDVPILIERGDGEIVIHATPRQHEIFGAFIELIDPKGPRARAPVSMNPIVVDEYAAAYNADAIREHIEQLARMRAKAEAELAAARSNADQSRARAEELRAVLDRLREQQAETSDGPARMVIDGAARSLESRVEAVEREAESLETAFSALEDQIANMENAMEDAADRLSSLMDRLDEHRERVRELRESRDARDEADDEEDEDEDEIGRGVAVQHVVPSAPTVVAPVGVGTTVQVAQPSLPTAGISTAPTATKSGSVGR